MTPIFIAEVKTQSPFGFKSKHSWDELFETANKFGDWISIHTDPRWGGSLELLEEARSLTTKPILAKGLPTSTSAVIKSINAGADYVLVPLFPICFDSSLGSSVSAKCLFEVSTINELTWIDETFKAVWNQRDLKTGLPKEELFKTAREKRKSWLCQASMIKTVFDVNTSADAFIVGEHLVEFCKEYGGIHGS